ncbi:hypothetical protein ACS8E9_05390 [Pseudomonas neustonica]|nr:MULTISPECIES: hypothetical protein [Pseudomonas]MBA6421635.1 hypothetical protein [Pseudomonas sp. 5Ae-yellow]|tara:strand:+ start:861 stop:1007 length:147 start_codon:yes stop_codon:yes gene_type:complete
MIGKGALQDESVAISLQRFGSTSLDVLLMKLVQTLAAIFGMDGEGSQG